MLPTGTSSSFVEHFPALLRYKNEGNWISLPTWATELIAIGFELATTSSTKHRRVLAIVLPTREMASVFIGVGVVLGRIYQANSNQNNFEGLWELESGASVHIQIGTTSFNGIVQGKKVNYLGERSVNVKTEKGSKGKNSGTEVVIEEKRPCKVTLLDKKVRLKKSITFTSNDLPFLKQLADFLIQQDCKVESRLDCVFIGEKSSLIDATYQTLGLKTTEGTLVGNILDILRPKSVIDQGTLYRSEVHSSRSEVPIKLPDTSATVIFDGATAFIHCVDDFRKHDWVVLLEHSDPQLQAAVARLDDEYTRRMPEEWKPHARVQGSEKLSFVGGYRAI
jgi:hypothetical protein